MNHKYHLNKEVNAKDKVVAFTNTIVNPGTMMVKPFYTFIADIAVATYEWHSDQHASWAKTTGVKLF